MMKIEILKLDFDDYSFRKIKKEFTRKNLWIIRFFKLKIKKIQVFKTRKGYHIYLYINNRLSNKDIVFLQLALGSDFMRECYYWRRIKYPKLPKREWNILFYEKEYSKKSKKRKSSIEIFEENKSKELAKALYLKNEMS